ncbi:MAG: hypothetical protein EOP51_11145 [Sphingobacteriales bacterium]|nr:MAG: hypothetical protein EOP51_11145 [Sphingobacteriales bacterium]
MKNLKPLAFGIFAIASLSFASCKKDYTCTCTSSIGSTSQTYTQSLPNQTRADAKDACENYENSNTGGAVLTSCHL